MKQDNIYKTKDIFEAAWLHSQNISLLQLQPDVSYSWFVFNDANTAEQLAALYWSQRAEGNIKEFVNSYKTLKDLIFSQR